MRAKERGHESLNCNLSASAMSGARWATGSKGRMEAVKEEGGAETGGLYLAAPLRTVWRRPCTME